MTGKNLTTVAEFEVGAGETAPFELSHGPSHVSPPDAVDPESALRSTEEFWREWAARKLVQANGPAS